MIRDLDDSLLAMLEGEATPNSELDGATISFSVPDATFRGSASGPVLNVYLYHVAENRKLRSNERRVRMESGAAIVDPYPARVQCTYVITAWDRGTAVPGLAPELQEHRLLSQALVVLLRNPTIPTTYLTGLLANPELDVPVVAAEENGVATSADFWSGLGTHLRPSITCRVTIAVDIAAEERFTVMTTARLRVGDDGERFVIGGTVVDAVTGEPVPAAWVRVDETGAVATTDAAGQFIFDFLVGGDYTLTIQAPGYGPGGGPMPVPFPGGVHQVQLTPL